MNALYKFTYLLTYLETRKKRMIKILVSVCKSRQNKHTDIKKFQTIISRLL